MGVCLSSEEFQDGGWLDVKVVKLIEYVVVGEYVFVLRIEEMIKEFEGGESEALEGFV
ncbi:hypothetical protein [Staphylococcus aureus]|uniref:hypothetical protein n=1 Tax=Staphylococcus aureus TaxID=1280 RepID=UPI001643331A|nr:hypothetical protein [Staphylococcus aureus]